MIQAAEHEVIYQRPWLYPKQEAAMFDAARISCIEASTKSGKTSSGIIWLYEQALRASVGQNFWWVAPVSSQARIAFDRMRRGFTDQDGRSVFTINLTDKCLTLTTGASIWFRSGDHPDSLYGEDVYACVVDEASRLKEESWYAVRSTLTATRGKIRIIGNVKGRKNWFFQLSRRAQQGEKGLAYHRLTAYDAVSAGVLADDEISDAKRLLPEHVFRELYLAEASSDDGNPFGIDRIRACLAPMSQRPATAWGWDFGRAQDWTVGIALDSDGHVCEALRFQKPWSDTVQIVKAFVGNLPALADQTGIGDPIVEAIKAPTRRGSNGAEVIELSCPRLEGYKFTAPSKQMLMEELSLGIAQRKVRFPQGPISQELENFEFEVTRMGIRYSAPSGLHDDCVIALALAHRCHSDRARVYDQDLSWIDGN